METRTNAGPYALLAALVILALAALACSLPGSSAAPTAAPQEPQPTQAPGDAPEATVVPTELENTPEPEATESGSPDAIPTIVSLDELDSYRQEIVIRMEDKSGKEGARISMIEEWVREPPAKHLIVDLSGMVVETIQIGDQGWMKFGDQWMESDSGTEDDLSSSLSDFGVQDSEMTFVGEEQVNGVNCKHYTFDQMTEIEVESGPTEAHVTGDVWVANDAGLPTIAVRMRAKIEGGAFNIPLGGTPIPPEEAVTYMDLDITNVNQPIEILPPEMP